MTATTHVQALSNTIRENFKKVMLEQGMDESTLAQLMLEKQQVVSRIMAGKQDLRLVDIAKMADALGVNVTISIE